LHDIFGDILGFIIITNYYEENYEGKGLVACRPKMGRDKFGGNSVNIRETGYGGWDWFHLAQDRIKIGLLLRRFLKNSYLTGRVACNVLR
jgi:hypothetical protein